VRLARDALGDGNIEKHFTVALAVVKEIAAFRLGVLMLVAD
jgi:hypothetical protein